MGVLFATHSPSIFPSYIIDNYLEVLHKRGQFNGVLLIADKNGIQYNNALGFANFSDQTPFSTHSSFRLASVSKQFTAMAVMLLEDRGLLDLGQDIQDFFPDLSFKKITILNLLQHTSGLPDYIELAENEWKTNTLPLNPDILKLLIDIKPPLQFLPGSEWEYSNTGYVLLALIIEKVSGFSFEDFLEQEIFLPLNMNSTLVFTEKNIPRIKNRVTGFSFGGRKLNDYHQLNLIKGDGGIYSTTLDLYKWHRSLLKSLLLPRKKLESAYEPAILANGDVVNYGFGWEIEEKDKEKIVYHSGGWLGFSNFIYRNLTEELLIVILTNDGSPYRNNVFTGIMSILAEKNPLIPKLDAFDEIGRDLLTYNNVRISDLYRKYSKNGMKYSIHPEYSLDLIWQISEIEENQFIEKAIDLSYIINRQNPNNLFSLGLTAKLLGFYSNAEVYLNRVLFLEPENSRARTLLESLQIIEGE